MRSKLGIGLAVLGAAALLALSLPVLGRVFGRHRLRFPYLGHPISDSAYAALAAEPGWARAKLEVAPQIGLNGLLRRPLSQNAPWVVFYPGNDESQLRMGQRFLSRLAGDTEWGLAVFAYRGYDSSDGKSELAALRADAPEIIAQLGRVEHVEPSRVHIVGFSIGGHFAVHAARGAAASGKPVASLTLLASVDDIVMFPRSPWEKLSPGDDYQTRPFLAEVPAPVLVLQGTEDAALQGPGQGRDIAAALGKRAEYIERPGVGHEGLLEDATALAAVRKFVTEHAR
jgi:pimeloyl-ACP methyl ester carboxylesterase